MKKAKLLNPLTLAYIGDAVYEVEIRNYLISLGIENPNKLQKMSIKYVSAVGQDKVVKHLINTCLTEEEINLVKRGRNTKGGKRKNVDVTTYRYATGLETLIGYHYLEGNKERIENLINIGIEFLNK